MVIKGDTRSFDYSSYDPAYIALTCTCSVRAVRPARKGLQKAVWILFFSHYENPT